MSEDPSSRSLLSQIKRAITGPQTRPEDETPGSDLHEEVGGAFILNVREYQSKRVDDVMVPRADIVAVEIDTPLNELAKAFSEAGHSRLPVFRETLDDPVGVAHIKDMVGHLSRYAEPAGDADWGEARILEAIRRPLLYVPASMRAIDLLLKMQSRRQHMALVVDEFGGTDGLVTLEDLLEPIVGDIEDEHDEADTHTIRAKQPGCWEADARAEITDLEAAVGRDIATDEEEADVDTLGGLIFRVAGRVPERGEVIGHPSGFEFEVLESDPRRIKRVRVRTTTPNTASSEPGETSPASGADGS